MAVCASSGWGRVCLCQSGWERLDCVWQVRLSRWECGCPGGWLWCGCGFLCWACECECGVWCKSAGGGGVRRGEAFWAGGGAGGGRQAGRRPGLFPPLPPHSGWADSRAEKKTRRQGNQSETNRFPLEVRKSRCCGCWWPVRLGATSLPSLSRPPPFLTLPTPPPQSTAFVWGPAVGLLPRLLRHPLRGRPGALFGAHAGHKWLCMCVHVCMQVLGWGTRHLMTEPPQGLQTRWVTTLAEDTQGARGISGPGLRPPGC